MDIEKIRNQVNDFIRDGIPNLLLFLGQYGLWAFGLFLAVMGSYSVFGYLGAIATSLLEGAEIGLIYKLLKKEGHRPIPGFVKFFTWCFVLAAMIFSGTEQFLFLDKTLTESINDVIKLESEIEAKNKYKATLNVTLEEKMKKIADLDLNDKDLTRTEKKERKKIINVKETNTAIKKVELEIVALETELNLLKKTKKTAGYFSSSSNIKILIVLFIKLANVFSVLMRSYDEPPKRNEHNTKDDVEVKELNPSPTIYKEIEEPVSQPKQIEPPTPEYEPPPKADYQAPRETRSDTTDDIIRIKAIQRYMVVENKDIHAIAKAMGKTESRVLDYLHGKQKMANRPFENFRRNCFGLGSLGIEAYDEFVKREVNNHA